MFELKPLSKESIPRALEKAERYRLLNEPREAESICLDVLQIEPDNQQALVLMLLALTDQFGRERAGIVQLAKEVIPRLQNGYERLYYSGIICERRAKIHLNQSRPGSEYAAYEWFREAMSLFEKAEAIRPPGNDDVVLRWNTCARILMRNPHLGPAPQEQFEPFLE